MKLVRQKAHILWLCLGIGFVVGIFFENLITKNQEGTLKIFQTYFLEQYQEMVIVKEEFLFYIAKMRVISFFILCMLGCFRWRKAVSIFVLLWTGFLAGLLSVASVLSLGVKGILLCLAGVIPHFLFYGIAYGILLLHLFSYPKNRWNVSKTMITVLMLLAGILLETYINPYILKWLIKIL